MENQNEKSNKQRIDVHEIVNNRIIELLEQGIVPWRQNWSERGLPRNLISKKVYRGINIFLLNALEYKENWFLTYKQAKELGASIGKGENAHKVIYWKWQDENEELTNEHKKRPSLRYYLVYNIDQIENIPPEFIPESDIRHNDVIGNCEKIIAEMPRSLEISVEDDMPYYHVGYDYINMPPLEFFQSNEEYYQAVFHEMIHATGHERRLNRQELMRLNDTFNYKYSVEELVAEMGTCYLKAVTGLSLDLKGNTAYIDNWLKFIRENKRALVYAGTQTQKAVDYILNVHHAEVVKEAEVSHE